MICSQENVTTEKKNLEEKLREAGDTPLLNSASSDLEVTQLKAEIEVSLSTYFYVYVRLTLHMKNPYF